MKQSTAVRPTAQRIADAINANCDAYNAGTITREAWDARQRELWAKAARALVMSQVMRIVCPSLGATA